VWIRSGGMAGSRHGLSDPAGGSWRRRGSVSVLHVLLRLTAAHPGRAVANGPRVPRDRVPCNLAL